MKVDGYFFIIICYLIIIFSGYVISKLVSFKSESNRFESIDGFRGLLATGVFIHHSIVWYNYIHFGEWKVPTNHLAIHLGESCVAFFFMITGFLFINKLINTQNKNNKFWKNTLYSRLLRLCPLYFFIMTIVIIMVLIIDNFTLGSSIYEFTINCVRWYSFKILGGYNLSESYDMNLLTGGVIWSLPYEWLFYFSLPLLSLILLRSFNKAALIITIIFILIYSLNNNINFKHILSFLGGAIPVFILKYKPNVNMNKPIITFLIIILFCIAFSFESSSKNYFSKFCLIIIFTLIALKNDFFGFLKANFLKYLGEISYSTYLIHGVLLFITFYIIGFNNIKVWTPNFYALIICLISLALIIICSFTFHFVEKPFLNIYHKYVKNNS